MVFFSALKTFSMSIITSRLGIRPATAQRIYQSIFCLSRVSKNYPEIRQAHKIKQFSSTTRALRFPQRGFEPPSRFGSFTSLIPESVRVLLTFMGIGSLIVFVAAPLMFIVLPPTIVGGVLFMRRKARKRQAFIADRDLLLRNSTLFCPHSITDLNSRNLQRFLLDRISIAFEDNENNVQGKFGMENPPVQLSLDSVEAVDQILTGGLDPASRRLITVLVRGLLEGNGRIGTAIISVLNQKGAEHPMVIELQPSGILAEKIVLNSALFQQGEIVDIKSFKTTNRR